ncbi:hypothetical protein DFJ77DRAFT_457227 [Powellomyces hirtus]|nr:hypothetical protein DFJ77DRAFT_457227 [Powellomyces hirtus]
MATSTVRRPEPAPVLAPPAGSGDKHTAIPRTHRNELPLFLPQAFASVALSIDALPKLFSANEKVTVLRADDNIHFLDDDRYATREEIPIADLLANLDIDADQQARRMYYRTTVPPELARRLEAEPLIRSVGNSYSGGEGTLSPLARLWSSSSGSVTPLHYDKCHGLLIQLHGHKRFLIFPRTDARNCYLHNGITGPTHASRARGTDRAFMDLAESSEAATTLLDAYPKFADTTPWVVTLAPGDAVYTPPGFLHEVTSITASVSVTVPWDMTPAELDDRPAFMAF